MTANGRHSYADVTLSKSVHNYKNRGAVCSGQDYSTSTQNTRHPLQQVGGLLYSSYHGFCMVSY